MEKEESLVLVVVIAGDGGTRRRWQHAMKEGEREMREMEMGAAVCGYYGS